MEREKINENSSSTIINQLNQINMSITTLAGFLHVALESMNTSLDELNNKLNDVRLLIEILQNNITIIREYVEENRYKLSLISGNITQLVNKVETLQLNEANNSKALDGLNSSLQVILANISTLRSNLDTLSARFGEMSSQINETIGDILNVNNTLNFYFNAIFSQINHTSLEVESLRSTLDNITSELEGISISLINSTTSLNSSIKSLRTVLLQFNKTVVLLSNKTGDMLSKIDSIYRKDAQILGNISQVYYLLNSINDSITTKLNIFMEYLNNTIEIKMSDKILEIETSINKKLDNISSMQSQLIQFVTNTLISKLQPKIIRITNKITGKSLHSDCDLLYYEVNGIKFVGDGIVTLSSKVSIRVLDYWNRVLYENKTTDPIINIELSLGELTIVNNLLQNIIIDIRPTEILDKYYETYVYGLTYVKFNLPLGSYLVIAKNVYGEKILEETVELKYSPLAKNSDSVKTIIVDQKGNTSQTNFVDSKNLFIYTTPIAVIALLTFVVKRRRTLKNLEFEDDIDEL